ncbi:MAG: SpoIIE family protein phosphatase [Sulfuricella sp.]|nr:SpoIIE family protein phosphatase [Sulfuricella sp.]
MTTEKHDQLPTVPATVSPAGGGRAGLDNANGLYFLSVVLLLAFAAFFYFDAQFKHDAESLRKLSLNAERILNANDATASAIRLTAGLKSERFLFNYDDLLETRNSLLEENLSMVGNAAAREALVEMAEAGREIEVLEKEAILLLGREKWDAALALMMSPHYKRQKGLYRANLSRALSMLVDDSERNTKKTETLANVMRVTVLLVFLLFALMGRIYAGRMRAALETERTLKQSLEESNVFLEQRVIERTEEVTRKAAELREAYEVISASIRYASRIQRAVLPDTAVVGADFPQHFVLWKPRDVVGGDIFWYRQWGDGVLIALGDCTGHGVPGAFMTLISTGALERACIEVAPGDLGGLLRRMHRHVQVTLGQHLESGESDDGIELGVCYLPHSLERMSYAGARLSLFLVDGDEVTEVRGTRKGLGYRGIAHDQGYEVHDISLHPGLRFYMTSDGLIEQLNSDLPRPRMFGKKRFKALLRVLSPTAMTVQGDAVCRALLDHQGGQALRDDVSVIGFEVPLRCG